VVSLVGLQRKLLLGLEILLLELLNLTGEHGLCGGSGVDAGGFDGKYEVTPLLKEVLGVQGNDAGLCKVWDYSVSDCACVCGGE
jgi:hypothetical protein